MVVDNAKNVSWIIPFKKFGMVRVKNLTNSLNVEWLSVLTYELPFMVKIT